MKAALDARYRLQIKTGDADGAGTDEYIWFQVRRLGHGPRRPRNYLGDFERGSTDVVWLAPQHAGGALNEPSHSGPVEQSREPAGLVPRS